MFVGSWIWENTQWTSAQIQNHLLSSHPKNLWKCWVLKFSFSEKATKIWKNLPLVLTLLSKNSCCVKTRGRFFQILWPSHNVSTLKKVKFPTRYIQIIDPSWSHSQICRYIKDSQFFRDLKEKSDFHFGLSCSCSWRDFTKSQTCFV